MHFEQNDKSNEKKPYSIQQMANLTGVKPVTLRAWENRYGLLNPERSDGRYRKYGQTDVDTILRVKGLIEKGISTKQAAEIVQQELSTSELEGESRWDPYISDIMQAISRLDDVAVEEAYHKVLSEFPINKVLHFVVIPLLYELGKRWENGESAVAEEHFFSVYLRNQLGAQFHHLRTRSSGPRLIAACLPGEYHELGLLIFALAAQAHGYQVTILGANMPLKELAIAAKKVNAKGIILSSSHNTALLKSMLDIEQIVKQSKIPVMIGGHVATQNYKKIKSIGATSLGLDIDQALKKLDASIV